MNMPAALHPNSKSKYLTEAQIQEFGAKVDAIREAELDGLQLFTGGLPPAVETVGATSHFWTQDLALKFGLAAPVVEN